jgi:DNA repair protein RecN (Recombination protein N)
VVRRVIGKGGRGRVYINNTLATVQALASVAGVLIELAGQHEHQNLGDPSHHLAILDAFGALEEEVAALADEHAALAAAEAALVEVRTDDRSRAEREAFLRFQLKELEEAALEQGEEERLKVERERLRGAERLGQAAGRAEEALYAREGAIVEELGLMRRELGELERVDPELGRLGRQIEEARVLLEDAATDLRRYREGLTADPERLAEVEDRLDLYGRLLRKHRGEASDVAGLIARRDAIRAELAQLGAHEERLVERTAALEAARARARTRAERLSEARRRTAGTLETRVGRALGELGMSGARLCPLVTPVARREGDPPAFVFDERRLSASGWDRVELQLSANKGEEPRPLHRIASGGELSRIMLALKKVLSRADQVATYVFDEVDAGIGGAVADVVGRQIRAVAEDKQVLCITHLPQIAAHASEHFRVEKSERKGRVRTEVRRLSADERREEIARMLSGKVTPRAKAHADEMLRSARSP